MYCLGEATAEKGSPRAISIVQSLKEEAEQFERVCVMPRSGGRKHAPVSPQGLKATSKSIELVRESDSGFKAIFENAAVGIARVGLDGRWLEVNQRLCDIFGYDCGDLMRKTFAEITHPDDLAEDARQMQRLLAGEIETYVMEKRYFRNNGSLVWVNLTVSLVRKPDGSP